MYYLLKNLIIQSFKDKKFIELYNNKSKDTICINEELNLNIIFPGYKTVVKNEKVMSYDYRVEYKNIAVSHANIVTDIYNKSIQNNDLKYELRNFLIDIYKNGTNIDIKKYKKLCDYNYDKPNKELIESVDYIHNKYNKLFLKEGNTFNYSIEDLSKLIPIIVIQEDINYPPPKYEGRKMSFYRYMEALFCEDINKNIENVITRTLSHNRPFLWGDIDYNLQ